MSKVIFFVPFPFQSATRENWLCAVTLHTYVCQHDINIYTLEAMSRGHMSGNRWAWFKGYFICVRAWLSHVTASLAPRRRGVGSANPSPSPLSIKSSLQTMFYFHLSYYIAQWNSLRIPHKRGMHIKPTFELLHSITHFADC